jgi:hypothetical protein
MSVWQMRQIDVRIKLHGIPPFRGQAGRPGRMFCDRLLSINIYA